MVGWVEYLIFADDGAGGVGVEDSVDVGLDKTSPTYFPFTRQQPLGSFFRPTIGCRVALRWAPLRSAQPNLRASSGHGGRLLPRFSIRHPFGAV